MKLHEYLYQQKEAKQSSLYMPYLTLGDPDFQTSIEIAKAMIEGGADVLELGIPFSDPTADGPVIQKAMGRALSTTQFSLEKVFDVTRKIHEINTSIPLVFLTYFNIIFQYKNHQNLFICENFLKESVNSGIQGLVIPDLPFDSKEGLEIRENIEKNNIPIAIIPMISPNTSIKRMKKNLKKGDGFVYYITSLGVTGMREQLPEDLIEKIREIRSFTNLPVFAGFGINKFEQASQLKEIVDGIIVGSLNHKIIEEEGDKSIEKIYEITKKFIENLKLN